MGGMLAAPRDLLLVKTDFCREKTASPGRCCSGKVLGGSGGFLPGASRMGIGIWLGRGERGHGGSSPSVPLSPQLAVSVGNTRFNEIMEAMLPAQDCPKPSAGSDM